MRELLVKDSVKQFKIRIPDDAKVTYGPFSPPRTGKDGRSTWETGHPKATGTLRIYQGTKDNIVACYSDVISFRDLSLGYAEEVAREEGAVLWKDDEKGYVREDKVTRSKEWVDTTHQLTAKPVKAKKGK